MALTEHALLYVFVSSHVVVRRKYDIPSRSKNVLDVGTMALNDEGLRSRRQLRESSDTTLSDRK